MWSRSSAYYYNNNNTTVITVRRIVICVCVCVLASDLENRWTILHIYVTLFTELENDFGENATLYQYKSLSVRRTCRENRVDMWRFWWSRKINNNNNKKCLKYFVNKTTSNRRYRIIISLIIIRYLQFESENLRTID